MVAQRDERLESQAPFQLVSLELKRVAGRQGRSPPASVEIEVRTRVSALILPLETSRQSAKQLHLRNIAIDEAQALPGMVGVTVQRDAGGVRWVSTGRAFKVDRHLLSLEQNGVIMFNVSSRARDGMMKEWPRCAE